MDKIYELEILADFQKTFSTPHGKNVLKFFEKVYNSRTSYVHGEPHGTSFNEGQRSVLLEIKRRLETDFKTRERELKQQVQGDTEYDDI